MAYKRNWQQEKLLVVCNFYGKELTWQAGEDVAEYSCILGNYPQQQRDGGSIRLRPYECMVLYRKG